MNINSSPRSLNRLQSSAVLNVKRGQIMEVSLFLNKIPHDETSNREHNRTKQPETLEIRRKTTISTFYRPYSAFGLSITYHRSIHIQET